MRSAKTQFSTKSKETFLNGYEQLKTMEDWRDHLDTLISKPGNKKEKFIHESQRVVKFINQYNQ